MDEMISSKKLDFLNSTFLNSKKNLLFGVQKEDCLFSGNFQKVVFCYKVDLFWMFKITDFWDVQKSILSRFVLVHGKCLLIR